jgi:hypothetical protein
MTTRFPVRHDSEKIYAAATVHLQGELFRDSEEIIVDN